MEQLTTTFSSHFYQWLFGGFFSFLTVIISLAYKRFLKHLNTKEQSRVLETEEQQDIKAGVKSLLKFRLNKLTSDIFIQGYSTLDQREDIEDMFRSYKKLGGNGRTEKKYAKALEYETRFENER